MNKLSLVSLRTFAILSALSAIPAAIGCSTKESDEMLSPRVSVNRSGGALSLDLASIDGVFGADCAGHTENEAWSAPIDVGASLVHPLLRVHHGDASCTLKVTHVHTASTTYAATPALALAATFASPSAFNDDDQSAIDFYGTAKLGDPTFTNDFTLDLLVNDATNDGATQTESADGFEHSFTVSQGTVRPPDFDFDTSEHTLLTDPDGIVSTSTGYIQLTPNAQTAQAYAVADSLLAPGTSVADLATAFEAATHGGALDSPYQIPASDLALVGEDLTPGVGRSIILRNTEHGISSYQVLRFDFQPLAD